MLDYLKLCLRIKTDAFDAELEGLCNAALLDLELAGVVYTDGSDPLVRQAVATYVKLHFGDPADPVRLKASYDEQKAQLRTATNYTEW